MRQRRSFPVLWHSRDSSHKLCTEQSFACDRLNLPRLIISFPSLGAKPDPSRRSRSHQTLTCPDEGVREMLSGSKIQTCRTTAVVLKAPVELGFEPTVPQSLRLSFPLKNKEHPNCDGVGDRRTSDVRPRISATGSRAPPSPCLRMTPGSPVSLRGERSQDQADSKTRIRDYYFTIFFAK